MPDAVCGPTRDPRSHADPTKNPRQDVQTAQQISVLGR